MALRKVVVPDVARLPAFCHASIVDETIYVSGMLGATSDMQLVPGGIGPQTVQTLTNIAAVLDTCAATLADIAKVNVYLTDMSLFAEMNEAYLGVFGADPPARITVGCTGLALGALVEMDCIAVTP